VNGRKDVVAGRQVVVVGQVVDIGRQVVVAGGHSSSGRMSSITIRNIPSSFGMHCAVQVDGVQVDSVQVDGMGFSCNDHEGGGCNVI